MSDLAWHFVVRDVERASRWYADVLGATETSRVTLPDGTVMTADLRIGDATVVIGRELPSWGVLSPETLGGTHGALHLRVDDADTVWQAATSAGATPFEPVHDAFWGVRTGQFVDPFGHRWAIDQPGRDVPPEDVQRLAAEAFAAAATPSATSEDRPGVTVRELRLVVTTDDYDAAVGFYRDVLGMPVSAEYVSADQGRVVILEAGAATLEIGDPPHAEYVDAVEVGRRVAGHVRVALRVDDATRATTDATEGGAQPIAPPTLTPWHSLNARLEAPGCLQVTLYQDDADH
ncbi:VOC family protein [Nocardioides sp.]|jgi:PhnB protein|uniref:VOC family protein n=1 Tax=Nocardioides sp. TaxID=35761 RepID=UPI002F40FC09